MIEHYIVKKVPQRLLEMGIWIGDKIELIYSIHGIIIRSKSKNLEIAVSYNILKDMELEKYK